MKDKVQKLPYSMEAAYQDFDITKPQPQLFVTPDFAYLQEVLENFANTMAVRKGGWRGLHKLIASKQLGTIELSTGLQVSGVFKRMIKNEDNEVVYFETQGETALASRETEVIGHGVSRHKNGFRSPLGKLKGINLAIENMGARDLLAYNFYDGKPIEFEFESGIQVKGLNVTGIRNLKGELMIIQFRACTVTYKKEILFSPKDGDFDMAVGKEIVSAFAGAADYLSFELKRHDLSTHGPKPELSEQEQDLDSLYNEVLLIRDRKGTAQSLDKSKLAEIFNQVRKHFPNDWLLALEIYELILLNTPNGSLVEMRKEVAAYLSHLTTTRPEIGHLIKGGLSLLEKDLVN
jgi:phenylalanine-4-hydroxylase